MSNDARDQWEDGIYEKGRKQASEIERLTTERDGVVSLYNASVKKNERLRAELEAATVSNKLKSDALDTKDNNLHEIRLENARLREALEQYSKHEPNCPKHKDKFNWMRKCICGLDETLNDLPTKKGESK